MATISNTSPLLYLHQTRRLDLLRRIYGQVSVAPAVLSELQAGAALGISVPNLSDIEWLTPEQVRHPQLMPLVTDLGPGETETIALGLEHPGSLLILDDMLARRIARAAGQRVTGTLGVLLKVKRLGLLDNVTVAVADLRSAGMWIGDERATNIIAQAGEDPQAQEPDAS